jgi:predicted anti-sigma-YlaC factor YlaD
MPRQNRLRGRERVRAVGKLLKTCDFDQLLQLLNRQLDLDRQLEVYDHLDQCEICRDTVYQLAHDQDGALSLFRTA